MWAIQNAMRDYQDDGHQRFHRLMAPAKAATKEYTREDSTIVQWAAECVQFGEDLDVDLEDIYKSYREFASSHNDMQKLRSQDFKKQLLVAFPELVPGKRKGGRHSNRVYFQGMAFKKPIDPSGNVVAFPVMPTPQKSQ
jgi:phage/plasmid-associated DNA primase